MWIDAAGAVDGYQICYDLGAGERALTWRPSSGFSHDAVDTGDSPRGGAKMTPILVPDGAIPWTELKARFARAGESLDSELRELVSRTLQARK